jgi:hypothetical protein
MEGGSLLVAGGVPLSAITLRLMARARCHCAAAARYLACDCDDGSAGAWPVFKSIGLPADAGATTSGRRELELEMNPV